MLDKSKIIKFKCLSVKQFRYRANLCVKVSDTPTTCMTYLVRRETNFNFQTFKQIHSVPERGNGNVKLIPEYKLGNFISFHV